MWTKHPIYMQVTIHFRLTLSGNWIEQIYEVFVGCIQHLCHFSSRLYMSSNYLAVWYIYKKRNRIAKCMNDYIIYIDYTPRVHSQSVLFHQFLLYFSLIKNPWTINIMYTSILPHSNTHTCTQVYTSNVYKGIDSSQSYGSPLLPSRFRVPASSTWRGRENAETRKGNGEKTIKWIVFIVSRTYNSTQKLHKMRQRGYELLNPWHSQILVFVYAMSRPSLFRFLMLIGDTRRRKCIIVTFITLKKGKKVKFRYIPIKQVHLI